MIYYMLLGSVAVLLLFVVLFRLNYFIDQVLKFIKESSNKDNSDSQKEEIDKLKDYVFFNRHANVPNTQFRTVTLSAVFKELLSHQQNPTANIEGVNDNGDFKLANNIQKYSRLDIIGKIGTLDPGILDCDQKEISLERVTEIEDDYYRHICETVGEGWLLELCRCPNGTICNWKPKMLSQFLFCTKYWDVKKIEIYVKRGEKLEMISRNNKFDLSTNGKYGFMSMSNREDLLNIKAGTTAYVVFTTINNITKKEECTVLENREDVPTGKPTTVNQ